MYMCGLINIRMAKALVHNLQYKLRGRTQATTSFQRSTLPLSVDAAVGDHVLRRWLRVSPLMAHCASDARAPGRAWDLSPASSALLHGKRSPHETL